MGNKVETAWLDSTDIMLTTNKQKTFITPVENLSCLENLQVGMQLKVHIPFQHKLIQVTVTRFSHIKVQFC
jgi:hypothetical protein